MVTIDDKITTFARNMGRKTKTLSEADRRAMDEGHKLPLMEQFFSIQGEGFHTGRAAYFIRLGGCDIGCDWCDTKLSWDPALHPLTDTVKIMDKAVASGSKDLVITGGEPLMYNLTYLTSLLKEKGFTIYLETSGAHPMQGHFDWVCLSPKSNKPPLPEALQRADELKVIIREAADFVWAEENARKVRPECRLFVQPEWSRYKKIIPEIVEWIKKNPAWRISLQVHKFMHIP